MARSPNIRNVWLCLIVFSFLLIEINGSYSADSPHISDTISSYADSASKSTINEIMDLSLEELLQQKVISASNIPQKISEAPATITVISSEQIEERGYQTVGEALQSIAGFYVLNDHMKYNVGIRGVNGGMRAWSRIIKVMINNQPVSFRPSTENFLGEELIPIKAIDRIEIIRGPASALYGANAFLGVINIISKDATENIEGEASANYGTGNTLNSYGASGMVLSKVNNIKILASGTYQYKDRSGLSPVDVPGFDKYNNSKSKNDVARPYSIYTKIDYENKKLGRVSLDFNYQDLNSYGEFQDWGVMTHNNQVHLVNYYIRGMYSRDISERLSGHLSYAYSKSETGGNDRLDNDTVKQNWIQRDFGCKGMDLVLDLKYKLGEFSSIIVGADYTHDAQNLLTHYYHEITKDRVPQQGIAFGDTLFVNSGIYIQSIFYPSDIINSNLLDNFSLTAGLRYDYHNIYGDVVNYRFAGIYNLSDKAFIKLLFGTSFKAPSSVQLFSNYITTGGVVGNPGIKPEKAKTWEMSFGSRILKNFHLIATTFYNTIEDKVELILPYGTISNVSADNVAKIRSAGAELELLQNYKKLNTYINLSYQKSIIEKENLFKSMVRVNTELYPGFMMKFGSNYTIPKLKLNLNLEGRYISSRLASQPNSYRHDPVYFRTNRYELEPYFVLDFTVSTINLMIFGEKATKLQCRIKNLLDEGYTCPGFKDFDIPGAERSFIFTLTQSF